MSQQMKLAKEIAGHWYSKNGVVEVCDTANCEGLEALIAAKLEPVRKMLATADYALGNGANCLAQQSVRGALALLSEEE